MKAIIITGKNEIAVKDIPKPMLVAPSHVIIKMQAMAINPGDQVFISGAFAPGFFPESTYGVAGVSGVGKVVQLGDGVPLEYLGSYVTVYRSLKFSEQITGTWSEYSHLHYLQCALIPSDINPEDYAGSLVNIITPYAFCKQVFQHGHKGIICTAGKSSTGLAMLGLAIAYSFPLISIVRDEESKKELAALGAKHVLVQSEIGFKEQLHELSITLGTTAVFDGIGGAILNDILEVLPGVASVYVYGGLGGQVPISFSASVLMRGISLNGFGNFRTQTVQDPVKLAEALKDISSLLHMPHFRTAKGPVFKLSQAEDALTAFRNGSKPIFKLS